MLTEDELEKLFEAAMQSEEFKNAYARSLILGDGVIDFNKMYQQAKAIVEREKLNANH